MVSLISVVTTTSCYGLYCAWHYAKGAKGEQTKWKEGMDYLATCTIEPSFSPSSPSPQQLDRDQEKFESLGFQCLGDFEINASATTMETAIVADKDAPLAAPDKVSTPVTRRELIRYRVMAHAERRCTAYLIAHDFDPSAGKKRKYHYRYEIVSRSGEWSYTILSDFKRTFWLERPRALRSEVPMSWLRENVPGEEFSALAGYFVQYRDQIADAASLKWEEPMSLQEALDWELQETECVREYAKQQTWWSVWLFMWRMKRARNANWWGELEGKLKLE